MDRGIFNMWKWVILGVAALLAWKWYKMGFVQVQNSDDTFNVKVRKLTGVLGVLDPLSRKDNVNFGAVEAPAPNINPGAGYFRTLSGSRLSAILDSKPPIKIDSPIWRL